MNTRGFWLGLLINFCTLAFALFVFIVSSFALNNLMGEMEFAGIFMANIFAIALALLDYAGISRLYVPDDGDPRSKRYAIYLLIGWLVCALVVWVLTWWSVLVILLDKTDFAPFIKNPEINLVAFRLAPITIAEVVFLTRILLYAAVSRSGARLFTQKPRN
ncbi:hypothetical protein A2Z33_00415 [Candidatus Gottesmanbacteria bacterium RBG_16_52_11]|uniref:Uncharacterized protein n=1 Tax=Candidatus Gottesmanbacteria bacterium RBG_16_52_11 TaxID=1798374 RepID=A0A1F5YN70_9BACT|nr:MAG: hypothetical protein A2Z33_00415 [Candidatus Gottesmanbacteria bacterium RBG_16_52_11]